MPFTFQIRPFSIEEGFSLSCEGILAEPLHQRKLINAIIEAVVIGRDLPGEIQIFDCSGTVVETLPLPASATVRSKEPQKHQRRKEALV